MLSMFQSVRHQNVEENIYNINYKFQEKAVRVLSHVSKFVNETSIHPL